MGSYEFDQNKKDLEETSGKQKIYQFSSVLFTALTKKLYNKQNEVNMIQVDELLCLLDER